MTINFDGYTETQAHTAARAWNTAMQSVGCMRDFRPLNTEAEADAIYAFIQAAEAGGSVVAFSRNNWQTAAEALAADARSDADLVTELRGGG